MLARFELFNDQSFYQNNRQDLNAGLVSQHQNILDEKPQANTLRNAVLSI
jgi:hypothetical protein